MLKTGCAAAADGSVLGAMFVGMQAFEWTKLIHEGVRPWENPWGAAQFGSSFFMITGFHGTHVTFGVIFLIIIARKVWRGDFDHERRGFFTEQERELRGRRNHAVSTGISSISSGSSSLPSSICGEAKHGTVLKRMLKGNSIRSSSISWCGDGCLSSVLALILSTILLFRDFLRWFLILLFMTLKAGLIVAIFMHMAWERLSLSYAILVPPFSYWCSWRSWRSDPITTHLRRESSSSEAH